MRAAERSCNFARANQTRAHHVATDAEQARGLQLVLRAIMIRGLQDDVLDVFEQVRQLLLEQLQQGELERRVLLFGRDGMSPTILAVAMSAIFAMGAARATHWRRIEHAQAQIFGSDLRAVAEQQRVMHGVLQLTNVARPRVLEQPRSRFRTEFSRAEL